jgi:hypothetical protein
MNRGVPCLSRLPASHGVLAIAMLALVVRALVPLGFMPMQVNGATQMMFCHGGLHHAPATTPRSKVTGDGPCAFAVSGGAALQPTALAAIPAAESPRFLVLVASRSADRDTPPRHHAPRGPPAQV